MLIYPLEFLQINKGILLEFLQIYKEIIWWTNGKLMETVQG